jgi:signal transduction histidine kinase
VAPPCGANRYGRGVDTAALIEVGTLLTAAVGSVALIFGIYLRPRDGWLLALAAVTIIAALIVNAALRAVRWNRGKSAVLVTAVVLWAYSLITTSLVPASLHHNLLLLVAPVILAAPRVSRRGFRVIMSATIVAALAVALAGRLVPGAGIGRGIPDWLIDIIVVGLVLVTTTLALVLVWENHAELSMKAEQLQESRLRLVTTADQERRRIERNLHDGAQQRLVAAAVQLRVAQRLLPDHPERVIILLDRLARDLESAGSELRDLARGIFPSHLAGHGLEAALRAAAERSPLPTTVHATGITRYRPDIELSLYFCCLEALQNAIKYAGDDATITITLCDHDWPSFDIRDTGRGCDAATIQTGHGYTNMSDRMEAVGGTLTVHAQPGQGVHLHGRVPVPVHTGESRPDHAHRPTRPEMSMPVIGLGAVDSRGRIL